MKKILLSGKTLALIVCLTTPFIASAYTRPPQNTVPLDGGLSFLIVAGAGYGLKTVAGMRSKMKKANKHK